MCTGERSREQRLEEAWNSLEEGDSDHALAAALALVSENDSDPEAHYLAGSAFMNAGRLAEAETHLRRVLEARPSDADARAALTQLLYEACRFQDARIEAEALLDVDPEDAQAHHLASLLAERRGEYARAEEEERMAHRLAPEVYPLPPRFTRTEFHLQVEGAVEELPREFRARMGNLALVVEDVPSASLLLTLSQPSPDILGLFVGTPLPEKSLADLPQAPDAVYLFKRNLERICESREQLMEEIRITLLHEVGHFLGLDEEQIAEGGYQ
jgi:predicted Zn-dependent protease with MMP-like domain